jgi:hypothetical protein
LSTFWGAFVDPIPKTFLVTPSTSMPAQASGNLLCPSFFVETTSGDAHVGEKIFGRTVESF